MANERRYQVFVSSTYEDLREERQEVMQALLELDCIPAGMELFPATDDDQWTLIKRVIDECDYYIVIIGGRYGSIGPKGISYTEQEYRYAIETGKPAIAFLHKTPETIPVGKSESKPEAIPMLKEFRELAQKKVCKYWETPFELGSVVSRSLVRLINTHPMPGWIRADKAAASIAAEEVLRLKKTIEELQGKLEESRLSAPRGSEDLAQGEEHFPIDFKFLGTSRETREVFNFNHTLEFTWNEIFEEIGPLMMDESPDENLRIGLNRMIRERAISVFQDDEEMGQYGNLKNFSLTDHDEQTIKIQLRALGLIEQSKKARSIKDSRTYWRLTPYGDSVLVQLRAIGKGDFKSEEESEHQEESQDD